jgi:very-short-patch-repair endonuclease
MRQGETISRERSKKLRQDMTKAEVIVWYWLRRQQTGHKFRRQHPVGPYIADFACVAEKLIVEIDGYTHHTPEQRAHDSRPTSPKSAGPQPQSHI